MKTDDLNKKTEKMLQKKMEIANRICYNIRWLGICMFKEDV